MVGFKVLIAALSVAAVSARVVVVKRQASSYTCGSNSYDSDAIDTALEQGYNFFQSDETVGSGSYPHQYNDFEGFTFPTDGPWFEFPILASGAAYTGGSPGADRVIFDENGNLDSLITHTGASGNDFVACDAN